MKLGLSFVTIAFVGSLVACVAAPEEEQSTSTDELIAADKQCKRATPKPTLCTAVYDPVCGCDGKTYSNSCEAARVVTSFTPDACAPSGAGGSCKRPNPLTRACHAPVDPVCGCDGRTYRNACEAARVVTSWGPHFCQ